MPFLAEVAAGLTASLISALFGHFFGNRRLRLRKFLGVLTVTEVRTTAAGVLGIALSTGIGLSTSDHRHRTLSYVLWYGSALAALVVVIACTVVERRRSGSEAPDGPMTIRRSPSLSPSHRQRGILAAAPTSTIRRKAARPSAESNGENSPPTPSQLADKLGRLYQQGRKLRHSVKPEEPTPVEMLSIMSKIFRYPTVEKRLEYNARQWSERVRNQLALHAPRFTPDWEKCPKLRQPLDIVPQIAADGPQLLVFIDARLGLLENIIDEVRGSRHAAETPVI